MEVWITWSRDGIGWMWVRMVFPIYNHRQLLSARKRNESKMKCNKVKFYITRRNKIKIANLIYLKYVCGVGNLRSGSTSSQRKELKMIAQQLDRQTVLGG